MHTRRNSGMTLIEVVVALAIGLSVLVTAASAVRLSMQTITKANRLSLENTLLRSAIVSGFNEADFWQVYDPIYDPPSRTLRDPAEPFHDAVVLSSSGSAGVIDADMNLPHLPKTWWRDYGYYDTYNNELSLPKNVRWGNYGLVAAVGHADSEHAALPEFQRGLLEQLGFFAALDLAPANTIWKYRGADHSFAEHFETYTNVVGGVVVDGTDSNALFNAHVERSTMGIDRYEATWRGVHGLTTKAVRANQEQHTWFLPRFLDGEDGGSSLTQGVIGQYFKDKWSTTKYLEQSADELPLISVGDVPEDWPTVKLTRISWFFRGSAAFWIRATVTDPLTGRQMALSLDGSGTTLRGARMQRFILAKGGKL